MRTALSLFASLILLGATSPLAAADLTAGNKVFDEQCADCHTVIPAKHKRGPSLAGVIGRAAGTAPNYHYSDAMANARLNWTPERLAQFLAAPKTDLPGTKMRLLQKPTPQDIANLIAWLQQQK